MPGRAPAAYARALGLPDPNGEGARRVNQTQRWLAKHRYIDRDASHRPPLIAILKCDGSGSPWEGREGTRWITIPIELWANGWIRSLSGRALALYIVLRELTGGRTAGTSVPRGRRAEYGFSYETWKRGCDELEESGLLRVGSSTVSDDEDWGLRVQRNVYFLVPDALKRQAA